jgi:chemotaxis protein histidine kinase CheA
MPDYKETYNAIMLLPCVQRIVRKNDKLRKENKSLRNLIQSLPEFRNQSACCCSSNQCYTNDIAVPIKLEKTTNTEIKHVNLPVENVDSDSDIEIIVPTADFKENIVYDIIEEEDKNAFECDDCNSKGTDCYEQLGLTKEESLIYMDLGEPDRCEDCFDKWKNTDDASEYLKHSEEEEEEVDEEEEEEEVEVEESAEEEEVEVEESAEEEEEEEVEVEESAEEEEEEEVEVEESAEEEEEEEVEVEESAEEEEEEEVEVEESAEEEEEEEVEVEESAEEEEEEVEESAEEEEEEVEESAEEEEEEMEVFEITINGTEYYTTNENDGVIYAVDADGEVGDEIGKFVNKKPVFA